MKLMSFIVLILAIHPHCLIDFHSWPIGLGKLVQSTYCTFG